MGALFESFVGWLDEQISERGLGEVLISIITVASVAGLFGTLFGNIALRVAGLAVLALAVLAIIVFLDSDRRAARDEVVSVNKVLSLAFDKMARDKAYLHVRIDDWHQRVEINERGDVIVTRRLKFTVIGSDLTFLNFRLGYYGSSEQSKRVKRRVRASVRRITSDGSEGARMISTNFWRSSNQMETIALFIPDIVQPGEQAIAEAQWRWPGFSQELMQGGTEDWDVTFHFPTTRAYLEVGIRKRNNRERFAVSAIHGDEAPTVQDSAAVHRTSRLIVNPVVDKDYGFRIDKQV